MDPPNNETVTEGASDVRNQLLDPQETESKKQDELADKTQDNTRHFPPKLFHTKSQDEPLIPFILHWTCVVLTVAASVVFGIWAPLSYQAAASGNRDNNAAQSSVISAVSAASRLALSASEQANRANALQTSQVYLLEVSDYRASALAMLNYLSFCRGQSVCILNLFSSPYNCGFKLAVPLL